MDAVDHRALADDYSGVDDQPLLLALYKAYAGPAGGDPAFRAALAAALKPRRVLAPYSHWEVPGLVPHTEPDGRGYYDLVDLGRPDSYEDACRKYAGLAFYVRPGNGFLAAWVGHDPAVRTALDDAMILGAPPNYYVPDAGVYLVASHVHGKDRR
jgi:hypothetical protein